MRRSDIIFAEAEEKKRRLEEPAATESGQAAMESSSSTSPAVTTTQSARGTKRGAEEPPEGDDERSKFVTVEGNEDEGLPDDTLPSVRAALHGKDAVPARVAGGGADTDMSSMGET